jgi:hypothetical protein
MLAISSTNLEKVQVDWSVLPAGAKLDGPLVVEVVSGLGTFEPVSPDLPLRTVFVSEDGVEGTTVYRVSGDKIVGDGVEFVSEDVTYVYGSPLATGLSGNVAVLPK